MANQAADISSAKLGLAVIWPTFWTGVPIKVVIALLFLAMGLHPWEGSGLIFLLLLSIPIDIWALGLVAPTVFLERLRVEPPQGVGLTLYWQIAALSVVYLPLLYLIQSYAVAGAKWVTEHIMAIPVIEKLPIAEKIGIELTLWGSVATVVLLVLALGWFAAIGWIVKRQVRDASPASDPYDRLVQRWDQLRVPRDQALQITVFALVGVVLVLSFWGFMPVTTPHPHEDYQVEEKTTGPFVPAEALEEAEKKLLQVEVKLEELEQDSKKGSKGN